MFITKMILPTQRLVKYDSITNPPVTVRRHVGRDDHRRVVFVFYLKVFPECSDKEYT